MIDQSDLGDHLYKLVKTYLLVAIFICLFNKLPNHFCIAFAFKSCAYNLGDFFSVNKTVAIFINDVESIFDILSVFEHCWRYCRC